MSRASTKEKYWRDHLSYFIKPDEDFEGAGEVFVPRDHLEIAFHFDGGLRIAGDKSTLQINFNFPGLLILLYTGPDNDHIYRISWDRLVGFELVTGRSRRKQKGGKPDLVLFPGGKRT